MRRAKYNSLPGLLEGCVVVQVELALEINFREVLWLCASSKVCSSSKFSWCKFSDLNTLNDAVPDLEQANIV